MNEKEFFEKMISLQEERNEILEQALFPHGRHLNSAHEEMNFMLKDISAELDRMNIKSERIADILSSIESRT